MKLLKILSGMLILSLLFVFACEKTSITQRSDLAKVANRANPPLAKDYQAQVPFYNVTVLPQQNDMTFIAISDADNRVHSLFGFQGEGFDLKTGKSAVENLDQKALKLTSKTGESVIIALEGKAHELLKRHQGSRIISEGIYGFITYPVIHQNKELSLEQIKSFSHDIPFEYSVIQFFTGELPAQDNYVCVAGGQGSLECSNSWCSVSCADGYWSCCNMTCHCIDADDPGWDD